METVDPRYKQLLRYKPYALSKQHPKVSQLFRSLLLYPQDIDRRLIYAEALEEFGDGDRSCNERAALIRTQVALAEVTKKEPRRKRYEHPRLFSFSSRHGSCYVDLDKDTPPPLSGERVDLVLPEAQRSRDIELTMEKRSKDPFLILEVYKTKKREPYKAFWPGVLVLESVLTTRNYDQTSYRIEFKVDEGSRPWVGEELHKQAVELFRWGDARGEYGLPPHDKCNDGTHTQRSDTFSNEIWAPRMGGQPEAKRPRFKFTWSNGFPDAVECSRDDWYTFGQQLVLENPILSILLTIGSSMNPYDGSDLAWARQMARLEKLCEECGGRGYHTLGFAKCPKCKGSQWVVNEEAS